MPVFCLNSGRMWPNRPESSVEVVEATTIDLSCAQRRRAQARPPVRSGMRNPAVHCLILSIQITRSPRRNAAASGVAGAEEFYRLGAFEQSSAGEKHDSPASRRAWPRSCVAITILTPTPRPSRRCLRPPLSRRDRGSPSARRGTAPPDRARARAPGETLLLAAGEPPCRSVGKCARPTCASSSLRARIVPVAARRRRSRPRFGAASRAAGTPSRGAGRSLASAPGHAAGGWRDSHREAHQRALTRTVRAEQDRRRAGANVELRSSTMSRRRPQRDVIEAIGRSVIGARITLLLCA